MTPIHKGIRSIIYDLGRELQTTDFTDARATEVMVSRLKQEPTFPSTNCLLCLLHEHAQTEEKFIFPEVRPFESKLVDELLEEHKWIVGKIADVRRIADDVKSLGNPPERIEMGGKLNHATNELFAFYLAHLNNEEARFIPAMWKHLTDEQLFDLRARIVKALPRDSGVQMNSWVFPSLNINELTGLFMGLKSGPAQALEDMSRQAEKALGDDRWAALKAKVGL